MLTGSLGVVRLMNLFHFHRYISTFSRARLPMKAFQSRRSPELQLAAESHRQNMNSRLAFVFGASSGHMPCE